MAATLIPKTWALIEARLPRVITELVANYIIGGPRRDESVAASGSYEYCHDVASDFERNEQLHEAVAWCDPDTVSMLADIQVAVEDERVQALSPPRSDTEPYCLYNLASNGFRGWDAILYIACDDGMRNSAQIAIAKGATNLDACLGMALKCGDASISQMLAAAKLERGGPTI